MRKIFFIFHLNSLTNMYNIIGHSLENLMKQTFKKPLRMLEENPPKGSQTGVHAEGIFIWNENGWA